MTGIATIAVEHRPGEYRAAAVDAAGQVLEFRVERTHVRSQVGAVFLGRARAVRPEIGAAFVDIGQDQDAFLNIPKTKNDSGKAEDSLGTEIVEGAAILVQVNRDSAAGKGARLTLNIRPSIDNVPVVHTSCPTCVLPPPGLPIRVIQEWVSPTTNRILLDDVRVMTDVRGQLSSFLSGDQPQIEIGIAHDGAAFECLGIDDVFEQQLDPCIRLPGGGSVIIEHTSAMTTIDVNVGQGQEGTAERLTVQTNIEAVNTIAEALRLRGVGGLIAIDFLKMKSKKDNDKIVQAFRTALSNDPANPQMTGMSAFGIVEVARRRSSGALSEVYLKSLSVPSPETVALNALFDISRRRGTSATITASREVIAELNGPLKPAKTELEADLGFAIQLNASPDGADGTYSLT